MAGAPDEELARAPGLWHNGGMSGEPKPQKKKRWSWWKTVLLVQALLMVGVIVARWQWERRADKVLQAEIDAVRARGEPLDWLEFRPEPIPDAENAAELYREAWAIALIDPALAADDEEATRLERLWSMVSDMADHPDFRREHAEDVRRILALSAESLALCRKARGLKQADWKLNFRGPAVMTTIPRLAAQRPLARLLRLAAITAHDAGDDAAAVEYIRDVLAAGRATGTVPDLIPALVQIAVDAQATRGVEQIAPALRVGGDRGATAEQVRKLIAELLDEKPLRESMRLAFMGERTYRYDLMERYRRGQPIDGLPDPSRPFLMVFQPTVKMEEARCLRHMSGNVNAMREETFPAAAAQLWVYDPDEFPQKGLAALLSSILNPSIGRATTLCYWQLAMRKMAATALAIRLYEMDTIHRPEKLADLVGKYLPALPTDPFAADGRALGYLLRAEKPRLYSIGQDGKDDGGEFALDSRGEIDREVLDLVFFLNEGDHPLPPCDWYDPTTRPAPKGLLRMGPGGRIETGTIWGWDSFPPATFPAER